MNKCKICGSNDIINYFQEENRILKCRRCGVGFLNLNIIEQGTSNYYEEASNYKAILQDKVRLNQIIGNAENQLDLIAKYIKPKKQKLLDVGAHTGIFVREANKKKFVAEGIEMNRATADWANKQGIPIKEGSIELYNPDKTYDVITMFHVLEHLEDPIAGLKKLNSWLNKEGYLILEVPNSDSYLAKLDGISWRYIALEHLYYFSEKSLKNILKNLGFTVIVSRKRNFEINYLNPNKLLRYIIGRKIIRDRFKKKDPNGYEVPVVKRVLAKELICKLMAYFIHALRREDHILLIAIKN